VSKFAHLAQHSVQATPRNFTVTFGGEAVTLHCLVAGEGNKPYWNEVLRKVASAPATGKVKLNDETTRRNRITDAEVFAEHCIVGWDEDASDPAQNPLKDAQGNVVPYSKDEARDFLLALAEHVPYAFDELRNWLANPRNFTDAALGGGVDLGNA
jgi:hypothetical protein